MNTRINEPTKFGRLCRIIRIERDLFQKEMAKDLKMQAGTLCSYELGRSKIPQRLPLAIADLYNLSEEKKQELIDAVNEHNKAFSKRTAEKIAESRKKARIKRLMSENVASATDDIIQAKSNVNVESHELINAVCSLIFPLKDKLSEIEYKLNKIEETLKNLEEKKNKKRGIKVWQSSK